MTELSSGLVSSRNEQEREKRKKRKKKKGERAHMFIVHASIAALPAGSGSARSMASLSASAISFKLSPFVAMAAAAGSTRMFEEQPQG
jgi:hypothetical protein